MKNDKYSLLLWCLICAAVIATFHPALTAWRESPFNGGREAVKVLVNDWRIGFGSELPSERDWQPLTAEAKDALRGYEGTVWLQRTLPELPWRSPYLFVSRLDRFEVYVDGRQIFKQESENGSRYIHPMNLTYPVEIAPGDAGKTLTIRTEWEGGAWFADDQALVGEQDQVLHLTLKLELSTLIYSLICLLAGIVGLAMAVRSKDGLYGWFALFAVSMFLAMLFNARSLQWFIDFPEMYYWNKLMIPVAVWVCIGFYRCALAGWRRRMLGWAQHAVALYALAALIVAVVSPPEFRRYFVSEGNTLAAFAGFAAVTYALAGSSRWTAPRHGGKPLGAMQEYKWIIRSYWTFTLSALTALALYTAPPLLNRLLAANYYLYRVIEGLLPNGLLLFMISMVMVMVSRIDRVYREAEHNAAELLAKNQELERFHRDLETIVEQRTAELEQANRTLAVTLQEKAETLAEMSVMEERSRIASEIHDVVGHTLTAAIVQLEAAKKLSEQDRFPVEKLELIGGLVRKGLDDIRRAVRTMKSEELQPLTFEESLRDLILYTEDTMEVTVDWDIDLPAGRPIGKAAETAIYHALQEGLTNGIRHGQSKYFRFELRCVEDELHFRLENDGLPFGAAAPGFGLTSMADRVRQLGGAADIGSLAAEDGTLRGCLVTLRVPLANGNRLRGGG